MEVKVIAHEDRVEFQIQLNSFLLGSSDIHIIDIKFAVDEKGYHALIMFKPLI